jgi:hypothetical protein
MALRLFYLFLVSRFSVTHALPPRTACALLPVPQALPVAAAALCRGGGGLSSFFRRWLVGWANTIQVLEDYKVIASILK